MPDLAAAAGICVNRDHRESGDLACKMPGHENDIVAADVWEYDNTNTWVQVCMGFHGDNFGSRGYHGDHSWGSCTIWPSGHRGLATIPTSGLVAEVLAPSSSTNTAQQAACTKHSLALLDRLRRGRPRCHCKRASLGVAVHERAIRFVLAR